MVGTQGSKLQGTDELEDGAESILGELEGETLLALWERLCSRDIRSFRFFSCFSIWYSIHSFQPR